MARESIISAEAQGPEDVQFNYALRPQRFDQYIGQEPIIERLDIAVEAAKQRNEPVEHTLLHGPPGLGKTTLAHVIANEMNARIHVTTGPAISKPADLVGILMNLSERDVLFIDEIHRLPAVVEEYLYTAMEDFRVDITAERGTYAHVQSFSLKRFTLIGATTRQGLLTGPMRGRFGHPLNLQFYSPDALHKILVANAKQLKVASEDEALWELSRRSRGTPRVSNRLLRRARDYAAVRSKDEKGKLTVVATKKALELEGIDERGLDEQDRAFLRTIIEIYSGGPVGIEAIAATMSEERETLEEVIEPFLLQTGLLMRDRRGRIATKDAYAHLGLKFTPKVLPGDELSLYEDTQA